MFDRLLGDKLDLSNVVFKLFASPVFDGQLSELWYEPSFASISDQVFA
jgi:hypothetical protein